MIVTINEFKSDVERYLDLVDKEEIVITKDGRSIATLTRPSPSKAAILRSLQGTLPATATVEEARAERLAK